MRSLMLIAAVAAALTAAPAISDDSRIMPVQSNPNYTRPKPKEGFRYPDCYCTDSSGQRVELGRTACLKIGSQQFTARCDMSVNNPTWRRVSEGCPTS